MTLEDSGLFQIYIHSVLNNPNPSTKSDFTIGFSVVDQI